MARAGWVKPDTDQRLSDHISIGLLTSVFPPDVVDQVVADAGRGELRQRLLPARVVVYYVLGLALFAGSSMEEVMRMLVDGLSWASGWKRPWQVPTKGALSQARTRLGSEPLRRLFERVAVPLAAPDSASAFFRGRRLVSIDGTSLDVPDTAANVEAFGRPGSGRGERVSAFPQVRLVTLAECGTHALVDAAIGTQRQGEQTLARELFRTLGEGMLCLADRGFYSFTLWNQAHATGSDLLWRTKKNHRLPVEKRLPDGSYLSQLFASDDTKRQHGVPVRVIEYTINDPSRPSADTTYRLLTTILEAEQAPAEELAPLYAERWEIESAFDELKTHQRGPRLVLRSKNPDGVLQEIYGYLCVHYAIRTMMHTVARDGGHDPDRISFTRTIRVARRTTASHAGFSPRHTRRRS